VPCCGDSDRTESMDEEPSDDEPWIRMKTDVAPEMKQAVVLDATGGFKVSKEEAQRFVGAMGGLHRLSDVLLTIGTDPAGHESGSDEDDSTDEGQDAGSWNGVSKPESSIHARFLARFAQFQRVWNSTGDEPQATRQEVFTRFFGEMLRNPGDSLLVARWMVASKADAYMRKDIRLKAKERRMLREQMEAVVPLALPAAAGLRGGGGGGRRLGAEGDGGRRRGLSLGVGGRPGAAAGRAEEERQRRREAQPEQQEPEYGGAVCGAHVR